MFGGSSAAPAEQADSALQAQASTEYQSNPYAQNCDVSAKALTKCLDENKGEYQMSICGWYLDQLVRGICSLLILLEDWATDGVYRKLARLLLSHTEGYIWRIFGDLVACFFESSIAYPAYEARLCIY